MTDDSIHSNIKHPADELPASWSGVFALIAALLTFLISRPRMAQGM